MWFSILISLTVFCSLQTAYSAEVTVQTCEAGQFEVTCPERHTLTIKAALWGRTSEDVCTNTRKFDKNCGDPDKSLQQFVGKCQGTRNCSITANNVVFKPDPCPWEFKYLNVTYECIPDRTVSVQICESDTFRATCPDKQVLVIRAANWGRSSADACPTVHHGGNNCGNPARSLVTARQCNGRRGCSLTANNVVFNPDPCPGVYKYLDVTYECVPEKEEKVTLTICDGDAFHWKCPDRHKLWISAAFYGRLNSYTCVRDGRTSEYGICGDPNTLEALRRRCHGRDECYIENNIYNAPLPHVHKYLKVRFECVPEKEYIVYAKTRDSRSFAFDFFASDATFSIQLHGIKNGRQVASGWWPKLESEYPDDDFQTGKINKFKVYLPDVGTVTRMDVYLDDDDDAWTGRWLAVYNGVKSTYFNVEEMYYHRYYYLDKPVPKWGNEMEEKWQGNRG